MAKRPVSHTESPSTAMEELTPAQVQEFEDARRKEEHDRVNAESERIRQIREEEEKKGKKKVVEKITLGEAHVVTEEKKPGLPERIKKLPKDHPERVLFEKGYRERQHREGNKAVQRKRYFGTIITKKIIFWILFFFIAIGGLYFSIIRYNIAVNNTRASIVDIVKQKHYLINDPQLPDDFKSIFTIRWLPDLNVLYVSA